MCEEHKQSIHEITNVAPIIGSVHTKAVKITEALRITDDTNVEDITQIGMSHSWFSRSNSHCSSAIGTKIHNINKHPDHNTGASQTHFSSIHSSHTDNILILLICKCNKHLYFFSKISVDHPTFSRYVESVARLVACVKTCSREWLCVCFKVLFACKDVLFHGDIVLGSQWSGYRFT